MRAITGTHARGVSAANDPRWRDRPEFDGLRAFIFEAGVEHVVEDEDPTVRAAFADNPDPVEQIRKLAPFLNRNEPGWSDAVTAAARMLGFTYPGVSP